MRRFLIIGMCIAGLVVLVATLSKSCPMHEKQKKAESYEWLKEVKFEVSNIDSGAIIKVTSDKPELVKKIQDWTQKCVEKWKAGKCMHEEMVKSKVKDPVCGMEVKKEKDIKAEYEGKTYYFCSQHCKDRFLKEPEKYIEQPEEGR